MSATYYSIQYILHYIRNNNNRDLDEIWKDRNQNTESAVGRNISIMIGWYYWFKKIIWAKLQYKE